MELSFRIARQRFSGPSPEDEVGLRRFICEDVAEAFGASGRLPGLCRGFGEGFVDVVPIDGLVRVGEEAFLAALFRSLDERPAVTRRFREGEVVYEADGALHRAVGVLEHREDDAWWLAWARVEPGDSLGAWRELEGVGVWTLPPAFRPWLDQAHVRAGPMTTEPTDVADAEIRMYPVHLSSNVTIPVAPTMLAEWLGRRFDAVVGRGEASGMQILTLRGQEIARWEVIGQLPLSLDDLARALAERTRAEAVAVLTVVSTEIEGVPCRAVALVVERDGSRAQRLAPIEPDARASDQPILRTGDRSWVRDLGAVSPGAGWIGVPPGDDPGLFVIGVDGMGEAGDA